MSLWLQGLPAVSLIKQSTTEMFAVTASVSNHSIIQGRLSYVNYGKFVLTITI